MKREGGIRTKREKGMRMRRERKNKEKKRKECDLKFLFYLLNLLLN